MSFGRVFNILFALAYLALFAFAFTYLYQENDELRVLKERQSQAQEQLDTYREEVATKRDELSRLSNDPEYIEQTIRTKLNYAKDDELVFRFE
ncbi:MAG: septum formation initiator family protein [Verrucomicrobiota bacterium]